MIDVEPDALLRAGLRLTARVPWSSVGGAEIVSWSSPPVARAGYLDVARPVEPNVVVAFREPIEVTAAFGVRRRVTAVGVCVDEPDALRDAIAQARKR